MALTPIKPTKAYAAVAEQLKQAISRGEFTPGDRLPSVRELSGHFGVSQAAVREALMSLQATNLVVMRQGEGTFVQAYDPDQLVRGVGDTPLISRSDLQSLLELRKITEAGTARLAALRRSNEHLQKMGVILLKMERDLASADLGEQADWEFHYEIAKASGNPFLLSLIDTIAEKIQTSLRESRLRLYEIEGEPLTLMRQHRSIYESIEQGLELKTQAAMMEHLSHVEKALGFES